MTWNEWSSARKRWRRSGLGCLGALLALSAASCESGTSKPKPKVLEPYEYLDAPCVDSYVTRADEKQAIKDAKKVKGSGQDAGACPAQPAADDAGSDAGVASCRSLTDAGAEVSDAGQGDAGALDCSVTYELIRIFSDDAYCERAKECDVPIKNCSSQLWLEEELRRTVGLYSQELQAACLKATQELDACVFDLSCKKFDCYQDLECNNTACRAEGQAFSDACWLLSEVLYFNRSVNADQAAE